MGTEDLIRVGKPSSVLLVEDNAMIALDIEDILMAHGISTVHLARTLDEAERHQATNLDLAILDFHLGKKTTESLAKSLKANGVPVIFVSGFAERLSMPKELMDVPIVVKPFTPGDLVSTIQSVHPKL